MPITFGVSDREAIETVEAFVKDAKLVRNMAEGEAEKHKLWFRGHSKTEYTLAPSVGRPHRYGVKRTGILGDRIR
jgi:hypothetical protein